MKLVFTFLTVILFSFGAAAQDLGAAMPNTIFYNRDGSSFSTYNIPKGKKTFLMFFDATCGHCQKVAAAISKRSKELSNINIVLISQDEYRSIDYFMTNFAKPLLTMKNVKVLQDRDHVFIMAFHPKQYPALYLYAPDKTLTFTSSNEKDVAKFFKLMK